jgi:hypothetical protein
VTNLPKHLLSDCGAAQISALVAHGSKTVAAKAAQIAPTSAPHHLRDLV